MYMLDADAAGPSLRRGSWGTKRRVDFAIGGDGESEASSSKSKKGDDPTKVNEAMQTHIAARKTEREIDRAAGKPATSSNKKKRVKKSTVTKGSVEANETRACELTSLLGRALNAVRHHEENDYPNSLYCPDTPGIQDGQGVRALFKVNSTYPAHGGIGRHLFRELWHKATPTRELGGLVDECIVPIGMV